MSLITKIKLPDGTIVANGIFYGTCTTAAGTAQKAVTCSEFTSGDLAAGAVIFVKFSNTNTNASPTLKVNSTTAKTIKKQYNNAVVNLSDPGELIANSTYMFQYNGTYWVLMNSDYGTTTTPTNASLGQGYATCNTYTATSAKTASITGYSLQAGGIVSIKFQYNVNANATLNISSQGAKNIYYKGSAITDGIIKAGCTATFMYDGTQYQLISVDAGQEGEQSNLIALDNNDYLNIIMPEGAGTGCYDIKLFPNDSEIFRPSRLIINVGYAGSQGDYYNGNYVIWAQLVASHPVSATGLVIGQGQNQGEVCMAIELADYYTGGFAVANYYGKNKIDYTVSEGSPDIYDLESMESIPISSGGGIDSSNQTVSDIIQLSESAYASLTPKSSTTLYIVTPN